ncbi:hypothetical protein GA0061105_12054 [Rhizobium aethiopicum]|uniref:Uncharacterized protein n=1 Tax=Rhizobium aethiopicum TaxID=1138170 RepID=A0A1C3YAX1_9HYPH|nr:hypothetical protein GA0061105_12054 [Rhizobium aethiopicum]
MMWFASFFSAELRKHLQERNIGLLEEIFLIAALQRVYTNVLKRITKTPKLHFLASDSLAAA